MITSDTTCSFSSALLRAKPRLAEIAPATALARRALFKLLARIEWGEIMLVEDEERHRFGRAVDGAPRVTVRLHDRALYPKAVLGGSIGAGESYMDGDWSADDLVGLLRVFVRNRALLDGIDAGWSRLGAPLAKLFQALRRNTRAGSRRNIAQHYDLGNEFFELFLDETLMYSCGIFGSSEITLAEASTAKLERICRKLALGPADHVLEIGTGWGGFALHAAGRHGCRVTTTTISRAQHDLATERIRAAGLAGRVEVLLQDYRELRGRYSKLVSIEMIEAVGHQYLDGFFERCSALLAADGLACLQAITIADQDYARAAREVDFIKRYVFPGSTIPSVHRMLDAARGGTDLRLIHLEDIGPHYATTLRAWRARYLANLEAVRAQGRPERFARMWDYYLALCEAGFEERYLGNVQVLFAKPESRRAPILPPLAA